MNQLVSGPLAIIFTCVFAWGIGFFLVRFSERVETEIDQSQTALSIKLEIPKKELHNFKK